MTDVVRLRNTGTQAIELIDDLGVFVVQPGDTFDTDQRTARILARVATVEEVAVAPAVPSPILMPVGARTAGPRS